MICRIALVCWCLIIGFSANATDGYRKMTYANFLKHIAETKGDTVFLENVLFQVEEGSHAVYPGFSAVQELMRNKGTKYVPPDSVHIHKVLVLKDVKFEQDFCFYRMHFHKGVYLVNAGNSGLVYYKSVFDENVLVTSNDPDSQIRFRGCILHNNLDLNNVQMVDFFGTTFYGSNFLSGNIHHLEIKASRFELRNALKYPDRQPYNLSFRSIQPELPLMMEIFKSEFNDTRQQMGIDWFYSQFNYINIQNSRFEVPVYLYLMKSEKCIVEGCTFTKPIDFRELTIQSASTNIPFYQIAGKIGIKDTFNSTYHRDEKLYQAFTSKELSHERNFDELIAVYSKLLGVYKYRGDQKSYNACYIEMKDIVSRKARYDYQQDPSIESLFEWRLAQFLKTFCDYGTSPVKSLIFSFYVILLFAGLYFLFPSEEDNLSRKRFSRFLTRSVDYFKTDKQLKDFQTENMAGELENLAFLRQKLEEARKGTPRIVSWIGWPFYGWMSVYCSFMIWFYSRTDLVKGEWSSLGKGRQLWLGILVGCYFLLFAVSGLAVRILNALALSLNVFVTLGYGEISASGTMRYLAVLEGLLGWFLLSIFSVSLIGQVLQ